MQEQLTLPPEAKDLVGVLRYTQALERLQQCLNRHLEVTTEAWGLDEHFRVSDEALESLNRPNGDHIDLNSAMPRKETEGSRN